MISKAELNAQLAAALEAAMTHAGWKVKLVDLPASASANHQPEVLLLADRGERVLVHIESAPRPMRRSMEAALARSALVVKQAARSYDARPVAVVSAASISKSMAESLRAYARAYLEDGVGFGWIDSHNGLELHGSPSLTTITPPPAPRKPIVTTIATRQLNLFPDLGQWLLKVLLAPRFSNAYLTAPRIEPDNTSRLAEIARVSVPTAHRLVKQARSAGLIRSGRGHITVVNPVGVLTRWRRETAGASTLELRTKWILRKSDPLVALKKVLAKRGELDANGLPLACLGLFAGATQLGLGFVEGVPPHLLVRRASPEALERLGLREASPGEQVDVFVRQPAFRESTFRGAVCRDGIWATDVIQTWLDTVHHPSRGEEQADFIRRRALAVACAEVDE